MADKVIKTRIINKHDTEANWNKAIDFVPMKGEIVVYDTDDTHSCPRFKVGDGKSKITALPFSTDVLGEVTFQNDKWEQGKENDLVKYRFKTSSGQYGAVYFGKEGQNSGAMIKLEQAEGTPRLLFRASSTPGAIVWQQPENGSTVYFDVDNVNFRLKSSGGSGCIVSAKGIIPNTNGSFVLGDSGKQFKEVRATTVYENGTALSSKYALKSAVSDWTYEEVGEII